MTITITDTVRNCISNGLQHLSAISLASGYTPQQVYGAIQYMSKRGEVLRIWSFSIRFSWIKVKSKKAYQ